MEIGQLWAWASTLLTDIHGVAFSLFLLFIILSILVFVMTMAGVNTTNKFVVRVMLVSCFVIFLPLTLFSLTDMLGRPKPMSIAWNLGGAEVDVRSFILIEGDAIYLYITAPNVHEPISLVLPWDLNTAIRIRDAFGDSKRSGRQLKMRFRRYELLQDEIKPMFYEDPPEGSPDKEYENNDILPGLEFGTNVDVPGTSQGRGRGRSGSRND